ncbi:hypothetical protein PRIPAC_95280, partial [Pristionchus pacificus]|uniref:Uncharacterized protein n=1 Tax=Pristionchus pacificus TaxID=54126 RepID=A0A2A6D1T9_PRIPA
ASWTYTYEAVCERIEQIWLVLAQFGVLKGAYFDMHPQFAHRSLVGSRRLNLTILPLVYFLPLIDRSLPPEVGERAGGIERAQTVGRVVISVQFYPGSQTFKKLSLSGAEKSKKIRFRRDVVWSQRNPKSQQFRESIFLSCARPCSILTQTDSYEEAIHSERHLHT